MPSFFWTSYVGEGFLILSMLLCLAHIFRSITNIQTYVFASIGMSFLAFLYAHLSDDFSMLNVVMHSHKNKPLIFKIGGAWGSHEGSMLLWCMLLAGYGVFAKKFEKEHQIWKTQELLFVLLSFGFLLFTYICQPFARLLTPVHQGMDMNPVLQDISLLIHPPHLYLGTIGFAVPFVQSLSYLRHRVPAFSAQSVLFQSLSIAFFFQTVGVILGSVWAYYELGWGGWWFFDPVENLALMPWLSALITLHLLMLMKKNESLYGWVILGCMKTFFLSLIALTLIRSGSLNSVHAFGSDPEKGILLGILTCAWVLVGYGFFLRYRGHFSISLTQKKWNTTENLTILGMGAVAIALMAVSLGTFLPVVAMWLGSSLILSMDYFIQSFVPPMLLAGVFLGIVLWKVTWTRSSFPKHISHMGFFISILGIALSSILGEEMDAVLHQGVPITFHGKTLTLQEITTEDRGNYTAAVASVHRDGCAQPFLPEERFYHTQNNLHRETAIKTIHGVHQLHITVGDAGTDESGKKQCSAKIIYKPFIHIMWAGFGMLVLGILWSVMRGKGGIKE